MKKIYLWGCGANAKILLENHWLDNCNVIGFIDKEKKDFEGTKVYNPKDIDKLTDYDFILITPLTRFVIAEIAFLCMEKGITADRLAITVDFLEKPYDIMFDNLKYISEELHQTLSNHGLRVIKTNETDYIDKSKLVGNGVFSKPEYMEDYFRYRTFEFVARSLQDIPGSVAEFGVYRGAFSALINAAFPDRKLYLYDTFEGFDIEEAEKERKMGRFDDTFIALHENGSVDVTLELLQHPENVIIRKGFFPQSLGKDEMNETFAFVSLDVDLEESTYQGLIFFYPRMAEGGVIFLHDYATFSLEGIRIAVKRYEQDYNIRFRKVPLADRTGTLVIVK